MSVVTSSILRSTVDSNVSTTTVFVRYKTLYYCNLLCYRKCTITVCTQSQLERRVREGHNKTRPYVHTYICTYVHTSSWPAYTVLHEGHKENKVNALDDHTDGSCCRDHGQDLIRQEVGHFCRLSGIHAEVPKESRRLVWWRNSRANSNEEGGGGGGMGGEEGEGRDKGR